MSQEAIQLLQEKAQTNDFFRSLLEQYNAHGSLSERQMACVNRELNKPKEVSKTFSIKPGQTVTINGWMAHALKRDMQRKFFFRNLEVVSVQRETERAIQLTVKFVSKIMNSCHLCGADLDDPISQATGVGPTCIKRLGIKRPKLEDAKLIHAAIDKAAGDAGIIGPFWLPKSKVLMLEGIMHNFNIDEVTP